MFPQSQKANSRQILKSSRAAKPTLRTTRAGAVHGYAHQRGLADQAKAAPGREVELSHSWKPRRRRRPLQNASRRWRAGGIAVLPSRRRAPKLGPLALRVEERRGTSKSLEVNETERSGRADCGRGDTHRQGRRRHRSVGAGYKSQGRARPRPLQNASCRWRWWGRRPFENA